ncbi:MAG: DUF4224 domain-containing protein [Methylophilaceae bacterium]
MFLTEAQLIELTGKKYAAAQARQLAFMGIQYVKRADGSVAVSTAHIAQKFGGDYSENLQPPKQPNWAAIESNAKAA